MRFLLDHDVPGDIGHLLRHWGHEAIFLRDVLDTTQADENIFAHVREHGLVLIACNPKNRNNFEQEETETTEVQPFVLGIETNFPSLFG